MGRILITFFDVRSNNFFGIRRGQGDMADVEMVQRCQDGTRRRDHPALAAGLKLR
jgi:hypothetical protein